VRASDYSTERLKSVIAQQFREAGFNWRAYERIKPRPGVWIRPPLFSTLLMGAQQMQGYLAIPTHLGADELLDIYERFISGFMYSKNYWDADADQWLRRELRMQYPIARSLFTPSNVGRLRAAHHAHLVQFAALVSYNYSVDFEHGPDTFVARLTRNAAQFGVREGKLVSNAAGKWGREVTPARLAGGHDALVHAVRGEAEVFAGTLFEVMRAWLDENAPRLGELGQALGLGLRILRWRSPGVPVEFWKLVSREFSTEALAAACGDARHFNYQRDPFNFLKELFTPHFISLGDFADLFGHPHQRVTTPVSPTLRQKWERAINSLDPGKGMT
jgi:hypothetical protein